MPRKSGRRPRWGCLRRPRTSACTKGGFSDDERLLPAAHMHRHLGALVHRPVKQGEGDPLPAGRRARAGGDAFHRVLSAGEVTAMTGRAMGRVGRLGSAGRRCVLRPARTAPGGPGCRLLWPREGWFAAVPNPPTAGSSGSPSPTPARATVTNLRRLRRKAADRRPPDRERLTTTDAHLSR